MSDWLAALPKLELDVKLEEARFGDRVTGRGESVMVEQPLRREIDYYRLAHNWLLRCHREGVVHVEPSIMPFEHPTLSFASIMGALTDAFESAEANWGITWRLSVAVHPELIKDSQLRAAMAMAAMHPWLGSITLALTEQTQYSDLCHVISQLSVAPIPLRCCVDEPPRRWQVNGSDIHWQLIRGDQCLSQLLAPLIVESRWLGISAPQIMRCHRFDDFLQWTQGNGYFYSRNPDSQGSVARQLCFATEKFQLSAYQIKQFTCNAIAASMLTVTEKQKWQEVVLDGCWEHSGASD